MWEITPQTVTDKDGNQYDALVKAIRYRPANEKELLNNPNPFRRINTTLTLLFKHIKGGGIFKITARKINGKWRFNLHEPNRQIHVNPKFWTPGDIKIIKENTGSIEMNTFFNRTLPNRLRDNNFTIEIKNAFELEMAN